MKRTYKAFTLTELLVALGVIAILCAILLPLIFNMMPNQNTIMAKRAYYAVQTVVSDLINDESCYPDKTSAVTNKRVGFDDEFGTANCLKWGEAHLNSGDADVKFRTLFRDKLGLDGDGTTFSTSDDMSWAFTKAGFGTKNNADAVTVLYVDVNGKDKPNCHPTAAVSMGGEEKTKCDASRTTGFDVFSMNIYADGRITINEDWAKDAVKVSKNLTDE